MKKVIKLIAMALVALLVIYTFYFLWKQSQPKSIVYELVSPQQRDIVRKTIATGTIEARVKVDLKPQITGIIREMMVKPGDRVRKGDVIAILRVIPDMNQLNQAQSTIESARIALQQVEREAKRTQVLYTQGVVSREENEQQQNKLDKAHEDLSAAQYQVDVITKGASERSGVVNTTEVRSTMDGTVLNVPVKVGTSVSGSSQFSDGTTIAKIGDMTDVIFCGNIDETSVANLSVGMNVGLTLGAMQNVPVSAVLEYIAPEGTLVNGAKMFEIKAAVTVPNGVQIRSGYSANANIILAQEENALSIDEGCVSFENNQPCVYKLISQEVDIDNQQFERIPVSLGISDGLYVVVKSGIRNDMKLRGRQQ